MSRKEYKHEWKQRKRREKWMPAYDAFIPLYPFDTADLPGERWLPIPDFEELYHVSNYGRTKSFHKGKVVIMKPSLDNNGYLNVHLSKDGKHKQFCVHVLVATLFIPNPDLKPEVNHLAGRFNNYFECLEWATHAENNQHARATGLNVAPQGTDHCRALFKDEAKIIYIRNNPDHLTGEQLADMFKCSPNTIGYIQLGATYANCGGQIRESQRRLTSEQKAEIRRLYVKGSKEFGTRALARKYGCSPATIWRIVNSAE